jgi:hypothetical protein
MTERDIKRARLDAVLDARGLDELVVRDRVWHSRS